MTDGARGRKLLLYTPEQLSRLSSCAMISAMDACENFGTCTTGGRWHTALVTKPVAPAWNHATQHPQECTATGQCNALSNLSLTKGPFLLQAKVVKLWSFAAPHMRVSTGLV